MTMRSDPGAVLARVEKHEAEITGLRTDILAVRSGLDQLTNVMSDVRAYMLTAQANKPLPTLEAASRYLGIAQNVGVLIAMVVAGIVYVSSNSNSGELSLLRYKVDQIQLVQRGTLR